MEGTVEQLVELLPRGREAMQKVSNALRGVADTLDKFSERVAWVEGLTLVVHSALNDGKEV